MNNDDTVSVIIVNFNGGELLCRVVESALASSVPVEVIVSDNHSSDDSMHLLEQRLGDDDRVRVIHNADNLGFARANNIGLRHARGEYILFLNPDCLIKPDTIERLREIMREDESIGMAGCRVMNPDGTEQKGCRRRVPTPWRTFVRVFGLSQLTRTEWLQGFDMSNEPLPAGPVPVDAISGSLMLVRRNALDAIGPLDEGYFLHCEDLDWCMRFNQGGYKVLFVPDITVTHYQGVSSRQRPVRVMWYMHRGMMRFYRKFFLREYPLPLMVIVAIGVWFRFLMLVTLHYIRRTVGAVRVMARKAIKGFRHVPAAQSDTSIQALNAGDAGVSGSVMVFGARSQIGHFLVPRLVHGGYAVTATSRHAVVGPPVPGVTWLQADLGDDRRTWNPCPPVVISLAPVWLLSDNIGRLAAAGMRRLIAFSSTSRFTKLESSVDHERQLASQLAFSEEQLIAECQRHGVRWTLFRPTMVYGCGMDSNVFSIAGFIRKFGCFVMAGQGGGCRQPVHADDLAAACMQVLDNPATIDRDYNLSGGETISYRKMVELIFEVIGRRPRIVTLNRALLDSLIRVAAYIPGFRHLTPAMVDRMEQDLCFDHSAATRDFGFAPRGFLETAFNNTSVPVATSVGTHPQLLEELRGQRILVTGAGGFIGFALCRHLAARGVHVLGLVRDPRQLHGIHNHLEPVVIDDICDVADWRQRLAGVDAVVHLAGYVHERTGTLSEQAKQQCIRLNVDATTELARAAAAAAVRRFVYISSVKVHGESSATDQPVTEFMPLDPVGTYALSKMEAETRLREIAANSDLESVIIRPPLVYGPGVKANFLRLMKLVEKEIPLPLATVDNRRSFLYLDNLVDAIAVSLAHPAAAGETFLISDGQDVSTPALINLLAASLDVEPRLFPVSVPVMRLLASVGGEGSTVDRLVQSLVINQSHIHETLGWTPPYSLEFGIQRTVAWYQQYYDPVQAKQYQMSAYASTW